MSKYICVKFLTQMNIRIYSHQIFWHERISEYIRINVFVRMNIRIYLFQKSDTNECPNKYLCQNYSNIRIYPRLMTQQILVMMTSRSFPPCLTCVKYAISIVHNYLNILKGLPVCLWIRKQTFESELERGKDNLIRWARCA